MAKGSEIVLVGVVALLRALVLIVVLGLAAAAAAGAVLDPSTLVPYRLRGRQPPAVEARQAAR